MSPDIKTFESISIGDEETITHLITEQDVDAFAALTGDYNPLHMDDTFAASTSFKKRVVHGMLSASFISTIIGMKMPGPGALWFSQNLKFLLPVRIGETIIIKARVKDKSPALQIITVTTDIWNSNNKKVVEGEARIKLVSSVSNYEEEARQSHTTSSISVSTAASVSGPGNPHNRKTILITGASGGIGSAIAMKLAADGFNLVLNYRSNETAATQLLNSITQNGGQAIAICADITRADECEALMQQAKATFPFLYGLVHNASATPVAAEFTKTAWADIETHLDVQVKAAYNLCSLLIPELLQNGEGSIVNISSIYADNKPPVQLTGYSLAKAALNSFSRSLAHEYGNRNIRTNIVAPGMTETAMIADIPDKTKMLNKMQNPMRRLGNPDDIAHAVSFLMSSGASYINGETIRVTGGSVMI